MFQHTPICSTCRSMHITPLRALVHCWMPRSCCSQILVRCTTSRSRLFIEILWLRGCGNCEWNWCCSTCSCCWKNESRNWSTLVFNTLPIRWVDSASKFLSQLISCWLVSATSALSYSLVNWKMKINEFFTGRSFVDGWLYHFDIKRLKPVCSDDVFKTACTNW